MLCLSSLPSSSSAVRARDDGPSKVSAPQQRQLFGGCEQSRRGRSFEYRRAYAHGVSIDLGRTAPDNAPAGIYSGGGPGFEAPFEPPPGAATAVTTIGGRHRVPPQSATP